MVDSNLAGRSVYITRVIPDAGIERLVRAGVEVDANRKARYLRPDELQRVIGQFQAAGCRAR